MHNIFLVTIINLILINFKFILTPINALGLSILETQFLSLIYVLKNNIYKLN